jgi:hypothetical protein
MPKQNAPLTISNIPVSKHNSDLALPTGLLFLKGVEQSWDDPQHNRLKGQKQNLKEQWGRFFSFCPPMLICDINDLQYKLDNPEVK